MQKKILLSIKPEFANAIFAGKKGYEFRRTIFKSTDVAKIVVYASSPVKKVIGEVKIESILKNDINILWKETKKEAGINYQYYKEYFQGKEIGYAIKIGKTKLYKKCKCLLKDLGIQYPPQSFIYI